MTKVNSKKSLSEIMFLGAILVIVAASLIILTSGRGTPTPVEAQVEGASTIKMDTPAEMMKVLDSTMDNGSSADFDQVRNAASGL